MSQRVALFGEFGADDVLDQWRSLNASTRDALIVFGAFALVVICVLLWALFVRKPKRRQHSHRRSHHSPAVNRKAEEATVQGSRRRKWRRPRRHHRPINPTLAETGGLPPARQQTPPESSF